jgi:hypothetical protein
VSFGSRLFFPYSLELAEFTFTLLMKLIALAIVSPRIPCWGCTMIGRGYLSRQALALLSFARATGNPELAALLVEKAARFKLQADEIVSSGDISPKAPDVETVPPSRTR